MSVAARYRRRAIDLDADAPFLPWPEVYANLAINDGQGQPGFRQGDHVAILGPTGAGKTHIALEVAEIRSYVLVVACKARDPLIEDTRARGYYVTAKMEIPYTDGRPLYRRVTYWPRFTEKQHKNDLTLEKRLQAPAIKRAFSYARQMGGWALVIDEGTWVCRDLKLQEDVDALLFTGRTLGVSVIILGQRPAWMGRYVLSQPTHLFLFQTAHRDDLRALGDIAGADVHVVREAVARLDARRHECLYINTRTRQLFRTIAPPR